MRIAILGCGEVGRSYLAAFILGGHQLDLCDPAPSTESLALAAACNLQIRKSPEDWLRQADLVVCAVSGRDSLPVLRSALPFMKLGAAYADFTTAAALDKRDGYRVAEEAGVRYVDVAIMGAISMTGARTPLLLAGGAAEEIGATARELGAKATILRRSTPGDAVTIKLLRSLFTKGLEALTVECLIAVEHEGLREQWFESLADVGETSLRKYLEMLFRTHVVHARRREHEVMEAEQYVRRSHLPMHVVSGVRSRFSATVEELDRRPLGEASPTFPEALSWLMRGLHPNDG